VLRHNGVPVRTAAICHINNQFVLTEDGNYAGLFFDVSTMDEAEGLIADRESIVAAARDVLAGPEPECDMGDHCETPYSCEFSDYCSACLDQPEWPISLLPNSGRKLAAKWAEQGVSELLEIPHGGLTNATHVRIQQATRDGVPYHDADGAKRATADWAWPRCYLDFETIAFAVPRWLGTKPWQQVPFQFSAHIESETGEIAHHEFLSLDGMDPRRAIAEALLTAIPPCGAIIAYNASFERGCMKNLAAACADLATDLEQMAERIVDLLPVTRNNWYHREQRGS